ncbi:hypothetical protein [Kribbella sp. NPDC051718]|uniref:hypothetical protein n=1 Tax=Kribbella sp. NPDC051718 TaxID=3155168 RepID=UPI003439AFE7
MPVSPQGLRVVAYSGVSQDMPAAAGDIAAETAGEKGVAPWGDRGWSESGKVLSAEQAGADSAAEAVAVQAPAPAEVEEPGPEPGPGAEPGALRLVVVRGSWGSQVFGLAGVGMVQWGRVMRTAPLVMVMDQWPAWTARWWAAQSNARLLVHR